MNESISKEELAQLVPLPKHTYPAGIIFLASCFIALFLIIVPSFLFLELPKHLSLKNQIEQAKANFDCGDYISSAQMYAKLMESYPDYKEGKVMVAKSLFALSKDNYIYFFKGLSAIGDQEITRAEFAELLRWIPEKYSQLFKESFQAT